MGDPTTTSVARDAETSAIPTPDDATSVARCAALASTLAMLLGGLDESELERMHAAYDAIIEERHSWVRHRLDTKWHRVSGHLGSCVTSPCGGVYTREECEFEGRPAIADRCAWCQRRHVEDQQDEVTPLPPAPTVDPCLAHGPEQPCSLCSPSDRGASPESASVHTRAGRHDPAAPLDTRLRDALVELRDAKAEDRCRCGGTIRPIDEKWAACDRCGDNTFPLVEPMLEWRGDR